MVTLILWETTGILFACGLAVIFFLAKERRAKMEHEKKIEKITADFEAKMQEMFNDGWQTGWEANSPDD